MQRLVCILPVQHLIVGRHTMSDAGSIIGPADGLIMCKLT